MVAVLGYVTVFNLTYRDLVAPVYEFWGLGYRPLPNVYFWTSVVLCALPALWMPINFARPSLVFFYVQYFLIFIPASFISYYSVRPELVERDSLRLVLMMFFGLNLIQLGYLIPIRPIRSTRISPEAFWILFSIAVCLMITYLIVTLHANFQIVGFEDIYDVRSAMGEAISATGSSFGFYAQSWLSALALPLLVATAVSHRRPWILLPIAMTYAFLFGVGGAKSPALALVYFPLAFFVLSQRRSRITFTLVAGLSALLLLGYLTRASGIPTLNIWYVAILHFRYLAVPALSIPQYFDFFATHALTHLSHVTGFNRLIQYPFDLDVPYTIGTYFYGSPVGANSGTWAADGIAGFGLPGILLASILVAVVFWVLDSASADLDPTFVGFALSFCTVFFGNVSLFTTLITGGLAFFIVAMLVAPRDGQGRIRTPSFSFLRQSAISR